MIAEIYQWLRAAYDSEPLVSAAIRRMGTFSGPTGECYPPDDLHQASDAVILQIHRKAVRLGNDGFAAAD